jgi:hypothetical protein
MTSDRFQRSKTAAATRLGQLAPVQSPASVRVTSAARDAQAAVRRTTR